jgi:hypothetical protein
MDFDDIDRDPLKLMSRKVGRCRARFACWVRNVSSWNICSLVGLGSKRYAEVNTAWQAGPFQPPRFGGMHPFPGFRMMVWQLLFVKYLGGRQHFHDACSADEEKEALRRAASQSRSGK